MSADGEAQEALINLARDLGLGIVGGPDDVRKAIAQKIENMRGVAEVPELTDAILDLACGPDISGKADMHSAAFRIFSRTQYRRGWEDLASRLVPTPPQPAPDLADEVDRILSGVKRYAFDATKGEYFEIAHGAFMKVDHVAQAIYKRYTPPQAAPGAVVMRDPDDDDWDAFGFQQGTKAEVLRVWNRALATCKESLQVSHPIQPEERRVGPDDAVVSMDEWEALNAFLEDWRAPESRSLHDWNTSLKAKAARINALRTSAQAHNGEESK